MQQDLWRPHVSWRPFPCPREPCILATPAACELQHSTLAISLSTQSVRTTEHFSITDLVARA